MYSRTRNALIVAVLLVVALFQPGTARAQGVVPTAANVKVALTQAKQRNVPLFFYVPESRADEEDKGNVKDDIMRALRDKRVEEIANKRFVTVKLHLNSANKALLARFGAGSMEGVICTPDGKSLGKLCQAEMCNAEKILNRLTAAFREFRDELYAESMRPCIVDSAVNRARLLKALALVREYDVLSADKDVATLLDRQLDDSVRAAVHDTLRTLSTPAAVGALLEHAVTDPDAKRALGGCLNAALDDLANAMNSEYDAKHVIAYESCCRMLKIAPKPPEFWKSKIDKDKRQERDCVTARARRGADEWKKRYGRFR